MYYCSFEFGRQKFTLISAIAYSCHCASFNQQWYNASISSSLNFLGMETKATEQIAAKLSLTLCAWHCFSTVTYKSADKITEQVAANN
jgi:hypothetical protein